MSILKKRSEPGNVLYFQSGGPTAVINATFKGLYDAFKADKKPRKFFVSRYGLTGILNNNLIEVTPDMIPPLEYRPGSYWGSLRKKLPESFSDPIAKKLMNNIKKNNIEFVFVNGGNDSMNTAYRISYYARHYDMDINVIGIPKTIDNDLVGCDHTPGFGTAAKYVANSVIATSIDDRLRRKQYIPMIIENKNSCSPVLQIICPKCKVTSRVLDRI